MKTLIYGAGVIGCIYAARLHESGCDVTLLARGEKYKDLSLNRVTIKDTITGRKTINHVPLTQQLLPDDFYDLIIVTVRLDQINSVIPILKSNRVCPLIMLMLNYPENPQAITKELNGKHILLGFPGVGGTWQDNYISYVQIKQQQTTIGEVRGNISNHISTIKESLENAGFKVAISANMQAWLKIHSIFIASTSAAIARENGDSIQLGKNRNNVKNMVESIKEGFSACKGLGIPIIPINLKVIFMMMPKWFSILYWQSAMKGKIGTLSIAPHANTCKEEMQLVAKRALGIVHSSSISTPTFDLLLATFIDAR